MENTDPFFAPIIAFTYNKTVDEILDGIEAMEDGEMKEQLTNLYLDELDARQEGKPVVQEINEAIKELTLEKDLRNIMDKDIEDGEK
jgi:hypothetical protein